MGRTKQGADERFWQSFAARLAVRWNVGVWLSVFLPTAVVLSITTAVVLLLVRQAGVDGDVWPLFVVALTLLATGVLLQQRARLTRHADMLVYLDVHLGLHSRLASAAAGIGAWPAARPDMSSLVLWRWPRIAPPMLFCVGLLLLAARIPVTVERHDSAPTEPPLAWSQIDAWVEKMREQQTVADQSLAAWQERLDQLRGQPNRQWYEHATLEASDSLRDQLASAMASLAQDLEQVERGLAALAVNATKLSAAERQSVDQSLANALDRMRSGGLQADPQLLERLQALQQNGPTQLSQAMLQELRQGLEGRAQGLRSAIGANGQGQHKDGRSQLAQQLSDGSGDQTNHATSQDRGSVRAGDIAGNGGISRGPGTAPIDLAADTKPYGSKQIEHVQSASVSDGELKEGIVGQSTGAHQVDATTFHLHNDAGRAASLGIGGDLTWRDDLTPTDRALLRNYFAESEDHK